MQGDGRRDGRRRESMGGGHRDGGAPYWEAETPTEARAGYVLLRHFAKAGKLQIVATFKNAHGEERTKAVVTLDAKAVAFSAEARGLLMSFIRGAVADADVDESIAGRSRPGQRQGAKAGVGA